MSTYLEMRRDLKNGIRTDTNRPKSGDVQKSEGKDAPAKKTSQEAKKPVRGKIKRESKKRAKQNRQYKPIQRKFLRENPVCDLKLPGCTGNSTQVHHAAGRENDRLLRVEDFKAACSNCHKIATEHSRQAIAAGNSKTRLGKPKKPTI
jgi:predicted HNH restriction endonuclease